MAREVGAALPVAALASQIEAGPRGQGPRRRRQLGPGACHPRVVRPVATTASFPRIMSRRAAAIAPVPWRPGPAVRARGELRCGTARPDTAALGQPSGIAGIVMLGPDCSTPTAADPCLAGIRSTRSWCSTRRAGRGRASHPAADGRFQLPLPPGDYVIQPAPGGDPFPRAEAQNVTVVDGRDRPVEIDYETRDRATDTGG